MSRLWLALRSLCSRCLAFGSHLVREAPNWARFALDLKSFSANVCLALARLCLALYVPCVFSVLSVCSFCVLSVFSVCSLCVLCVFSVCSQCVHSVFSVRSVCSLCVLSVVSVRSQYFLSICSCVFSVCSLSFLSLSYLVFPIFLDMVITVSANADTRRP